MIREAEIGFGDEIQASALARGAAARGKRVAFGDGARQIWSPQSHEIFRGNPNIAPLGSERDPDIEWCDHYRGHRPYGDCVSGVWQFRDFVCPPGEVFLTKEEKAFAMSRVWGADPVVVIEPRVKPRGACDGANKTWPAERYDVLANALGGGSVLSGLRCVQLVPPGATPLLRFADTIETPSFRHALAVLGLASLYIGPEGGLHHGAAAMGTPAVVIFGGFNTPRSTGYAWHANITVGEPCGQVAACEHCREAMASISVDRVLDGAMRQLGKARGSLMVKQVHGAWLPDREDYLIQDIAASPRFAGGPSVQLKKYIRALPEVRQYRHAVDIGANVGLWTRVMAACFDKVTAFEPNPETEEAFWLNVRQFADYAGPVKLHALALGAEPGEVRLHTKLRSTGFTRVKDDGDTAVEQRTLDSFGLEDVDFIKIDVEGWEHNVIKGGVETIRRCRPVMIVEQKPGNAELHGLKQFGAVNLLKKWGAREVANVSGDVIMVW